MQLLAIHHLTFLKVYWWMALVDTFLPVDVVLLEFICNVEKYMCTCMKHTRSVSVVFCLEVFLLLCWSGCLFFFLIKSLHKMAHFCPFTKWSSNFVIYMENLIVISEISCTAAWLCTSPCSLTVILMYDICCVYYSWGEKSLPISPLLKCFLD